MKFIDVRPLHRWTLRKTAEWKRLPTVREAARRFSCSLDAVEIACGDANVHGLDMELVSHRGAGDVPLGDMMIEAWEQA